MLELIIIKTNESEKVKKFLQEWQNLSDKELIAEWEKLPHDGRENN